MATLTRVKTRVEPEPLVDLDSHIPTPFPREQLIQQNSVEQSKQTEDSEASPCEAGPSITVEPPAVSESVSIKDVMPSIFHVQKSCLMTLNNLLSGPIGWHPIIPDRRHSMPQSATVSSEDSSSTSALQTLVTNLRNYGTNGEMIEVRDSGSDGELLSELRVRVEAISSSLTPIDAGLAIALVSLLSDLNRLSELQASVSPFPSPSLDVDTSSILDAPPPIDMYDTLSRQLSDLQVERTNSSQNQVLPGTSPLVVVESALLWSRIDSELENVLAMCKQRTVPYEHLPPQYDLADYEDDLENPPDYDGRLSLDDHKSKTAHPQLMSISDDKMRLDLEAVTMAIDRLYLVAPQLHNQRVELKSTKLAQMERARREGKNSTVSQRKGKEKDIKELEGLLELIGKASERTLKDQSVILDGNMQARLEKARRRESAKRDAFVEQLVRHSEAGRIHGQDAVLQPRNKDPEALLSLPEFMREPIPASAGERLKDATDLLTLPEFVKEGMPAYLSEPEQEPQTVSAGGKSKEKRHRSISAPPLSWLRSSSSRNSSASNTSTSNSSAKGKAKAIATQGFDVVYVAENHENLNHTLVFATITGGKTGAEIQAEVLPPFLGNASDGSDHLVIKSGPHSSLPLMLPAHIIPGLKDVRVQSGHYEIKLMNQAHPVSTTSSSSSLLPTTPEQTDDTPPPLLDATQLASINPTSFLCASCSLPLIQSSRVMQYRDLPSEHWEELVEAWMCHGDQKLNEQVAKQGRRGFWPARGQGLVGGSYILFEQDAMIENNLHLTQESRLDDNWRLTRCLCGAIVGRCQAKPTDDTTGSTSVFRILKYAVRPVSQTSEPLKIPLSAFIVEDMIEFVHAHASYRFVIQDEEEEKPRILIWLFKPKIRLAYTTPASRAIPKSANIVAAKVLYKLLKPSDQVLDIKSILNKYPGFPQAEFLSYPMPICRRLAGLLKESNTAYPESLRMMTGLEVGWLQRI
ncbi:hypothetical protein JR316_0009038 [Psilocybe cubensis]|uniref:HECT-like ubiquitin-conjugating enzyme-binding-domain-containing protein n=2 Tax=Psilocybe cubensis TaxID=181762 RepID=A0A8H7XUM1_PSICU|nr:hypothetical protein JR316_0009038 [Psilocybe cubensis]KAH9478581.1 hypothetical protein JR316_0009038 [Psilocybe cubensis]